MARNTALLSALADAADADTVIVDSLKDATVKLIDDETGAGWNRARQLAIVAGAELIELHAPRKAQADNRKPSKLDDMYGSRWLAQGAGSVICVWGQPGDLVVEGSHLKPPAAQLPPWTMTIDPAAGTVARDAPIDLVEQIALRGTNGLTADGAARLLFGTDKPTKPQVEKARYRLTRKTGAGVLFCREGSRGGADGGEAATWFLAARGDQTSDQSDQKNSP
jgi:replicative DNA helicase